MDSKKCLTIEEWKATLDTADAVFEGVKAAEKWKPGKQVTKDTYTKACKSFENAPADGRDKEAKG